VPSGDGRTIRRSGERDGADDVPTPARDRSGPLPALARVLGVLVPVAALAVIPTLAIEASDPDGAAAHLAVALDGAIWSIFLLELLVRLRLSDDRRAWLRGHPLEVAIVVLTPPFLPAVRRERPEDDRRVVLVSITAEGLETLRNARRYHRDGIARHFTEHLTDAELQGLAATLEKVRAHVRPLRPGRVT